MIWNRHLAVAAISALVGLAAGVLLTGNAADVLFIAAFLFVVAVLIGTGFTVGALTERRAAEQRLEVALALRREGEQMRADKHTTRRFHDRLREQAQQGRQP